MCKVIDLIRIYMVHLFQMVLCLIMKYYQIWYLDFARKFFYNWQKHAKSGDDMFIRGKDLHTSIYLFIWANTCLSWLSLWFIIQSQTSNLILTVFLHQEAPVCECLHLTDKLITFQMSKICKLSQRWSTNLDNLYLKSCCSRHILVTGQLTKLNQNKVFVKTDLEVITNNYLSVFDWGLPRR